MIRVLLLLALASSAWATPLHFSGFDGADATASPSTKLLEFTFTGATTGTGLLSRQGVSSGHSHNANNGGSGTSQMSLIFSVTSGQQRYATDTLSTSIAQGSLHLTMHQDSDPTGTAREIMEVNMGGTVGCFVVENTDRTLSMYLNTTGTQIGSPTAEKLLTKHCSGDYLTGCTVNGDCASGTCLSCTNATGIGCFWPNIKLVQSNTATTVDCDLYFNGRKTISGSPTAFGSVANITAFKWGAIGTESGANTIWMDDEEADDANGPSNMYVDRIVAFNENAASTWKHQNCTLGKDCLNDYGVSPYVIRATTDVVQTSGTTKIETIDAFSTQGAIGTDTQSFLSTSPYKIIGVEGLLFGFGTTGSSNTTLTEKLLVNGTLGTAHSITLASDNTAKLLDRNMFLISPVSDKSTWNDTQIGQIGLVVQTGGTVNANPRLMAEMFYVGVQQPDAPIPITLKDHDMEFTCTCSVNSDCVTSGSGGKCGNIVSGTGKCFKGAYQRVKCVSDSDCNTGFHCTQNDGQITVYAIGDSTNGGTLSNFCSDHTQCTQPDYCDWDINKDTPVGGCQGDSTLCQTCSLTTGNALINGNAGYKCDGSHLCTDGTCGGSGLCNQNDNIPCLTDNDCKNLGTCLSSAQCVNSCPGTEICQNKGAWGDYLAVGASGDPIGADNIGSCGAPGLTFAALMNKPAGQDASAYALTMDMRPGQTCTYGSCVTLCNMIRGSGQCSCSTDADCDGTSNSCQGSGSKKFCVVGARANCLSDFGYCAGGQRCIMPPGDYANIHMGYNDINTFQTPDCKGEFGIIAGLGGIYPTQCAPGTITSCRANSTCASATGSSESQCMGIYKTLTSELCSSNFLSNGGSCTVYAPSCNTDHDCDVATSTTSQFTCSGGTPGKNYKTGFCNCGADAVTGPCPQSEGGKPYGCRGGFCRLNCSFDSDCGGASGSCHLYSTPTQRVCDGGCTRPSSSYACTTDKDCDKNTSFAINGVLSYKTRGYCNRTTGQCSCMGLQGCEADVAAGYCKDQYYQLAATTGRLEILKTWEDAFHQNAGLVASGTPPMLIPSTLVDLAFDCEDNRPKRGDIAYVSDYLKMKYPLVTDARKASRTISATDCHGDTDAVHFLVACSKLVGQESANVFNSLNVCATTRGSAGLGIKYCKKVSDGTFPTSGCLTDSTNCTCSVPSDCVSTQVCQTKPCSSNSDCAVGICNNESFYYF